MNCKQLWRVTSPVILLTLCFSNLPTTGHALPPKNTLANLGWMSGSWQTAPGERVQIEEHWMTPGGTSMLGMSRTISGGRTIEFEYLRLEQRGEEIFYVAHPKARYPGTDFKLTRLSDKEAVFENPEHDFPKRIIYRKGLDGSLTASIDGGEGTRTMKYSYVPMLR